MGTLYMNLLSIIKNLKNLSPTCIASRYSLQKTMCKKSINFKHINTILIKYQDDL